VYLPAMIFHKALGLVRLLLFTRLLGKVQNDLWSQGLMIFSVLAPLVCLGSNHGLTRYVSFYEARGRLGHFYRRARWAVLACCTLLSLAALAAGKPITRAVISVATGQSDTGFDQQLVLCWVTIANAMLLALYYNLLAFLSGMRLYRLISAIEITFGLLFAALGCAALAADASGLALLLAHLTSVGLALAAGTALLQVAVRREETNTAHEKLGTDPSFGGRNWGLSLVSPVPQARDGVLALLRFGFVALLAGELGVVAGQLSYFLVHKRLGHEAGGVFSVFRQLAEPVAFLAAAAWTVIYGHAARRWEGGNGSTSSPSNGPAGSPSPAQSNDRIAATANLQAAYKAVALGTMTLTVLLQATAPLWLRMLDPRWRDGAALLPGMLLFYQMVGNLGLVSMGAWLIERPVLAMLPPAVGLAANWLLAQWWMPQYGATGAAWAAGAGMAVGGGLSGALCLLLSRMRLAGGTYLVLLSPALLPLVLVSGWAPLAAWGAVLAAALGTGWIFDRGQKAYLWSAARRAMAGMRKKQTAE
jgi:O-antigen/teichoic acid export membrane protein